MRPLRSSWVVGFEAPKEKPKSELFEAPPEAPPKIEAPRVRRSEPPRKNRVRKPLTEEQKVAKNARAKARHHAARPGIAARIAETQRRREKANQEAGQLEPRTTRADEVLDMVEKLGAVSPDDVAKAFAIQKGSASSILSELVRGGQLIREAFRVYTLPRKGKQTT